MVTKLWKFLATDKQAAENTKTASESAKAVFALAKTIQEKSADAGALKPHIEKISSLLDVLNHPIAQIVKDTIPFAPIAITILQIVFKQKDPTLEESVALVSQAAYLESLRSLYQESPTLLDRVADVPVTDPVSQQIRKLSDFDLDAEDARRAMLFFHESALAKSFNGVLQARLEQAGLESTEAESFVDRVARRTNDFMLSELAKISDRSRQLAQWYQLGGREALERYLSIEEYLRDYISPDSTEQILRDRWRVFDEAFTLKDLYVPLKAQSLDTNGEATKELPVGMMEWAKASLNDDRAKVLFIQGNPGRGKSAFCRMFAEWLREHEHPRWTPILIRLRDVRTLENDFEETLRKAVDREFTRGDSGWLNDRNTRFVFLLDGFDELLMQGRTSGGLAQFLDQVERFGRSCRENSEKGHRVIVTGRTLSIQGIARQMPENFDRVEIELMDGALQSQWFAKWLHQVGSDKALAFQQFLCNERCPSRVKELAREPLLLYLLAAMHRDQELTLGMFVGAVETEAKMRIYDRTIKWVLTKQRPDFLNRKITELEIEDLRSILAEAGLCVVQSGGECAPISMIEARLSGNSNVGKLLGEARKRLGESPLRNALAAFYVQPASRKGEGGSVEFIHKSFGEFLCAERLRETLESWTEAGRRREKFYVPTEQMNWEIYDVLGLPILSREIVDYLMVLLSRNSEFQPVVLFERLHEFYERWYEGEFIDALSENLPQRKMRALKEQLPEQEKPLGIRQIDVYAGLNVLILLLELHRYGQERDELKHELSFNPCESTGDQQCLMKIINYSSCAGVGVFVEIVGQFLSGVDFSRVILKGVDFSKLVLKDSDFSNAVFENVNFSDCILSTSDFSHSNLARTDFDSADLEATDFNSCNISNADFAESDLSEANLSNCKIAYTDFSGARLSGAKLYGSSLRSVNFTRVYFGSTDGGDYFLDGADLSNVILQDVDLSYADFSTETIGVDLSNLSSDESVCWDNVQNLEYAQNIPEALKQQLGLE